MLWTRGKMAYVQWDTADGPLFPSLVPVKVHVWREGRDIDRAFVQSLAQQDPGFGQSLRTAVEQKWQCAKRLPPHLHTCILTGSLHRELGSSRA